MKEVEKSMKFTGVEHFDRFDDEVVFWAELSGVPHEIQDKARAIDGEAYNPRCFGLCVFHSHTSKEWEIVTDTDLSNGDSRNIYYVDNNGDKHWFKAELPDSFIRQVFEACARVDDGRDAIQGYVVKASTLFENGRGVALAENLKAPQPFVTWMFTQDQNGRRDYEWGRYFQDRGEATKDFRARTDDYRRSYGVQEVKQPIAQQLQAAESLQQESGGPAMPKKNAVRDDR